MPAIRAVGERPSVEAGCEYKEVFFATPSFDKSVCPDHDVSMVATAILLSRVGIPIHRDILGGSCFIDQARNSLVDRFLATDATHLFFIDADVGWDPKVVTRILSYKQEVVGGLVPKRVTLKEGRGIENDVYHHNALTGIIEDGLFQSLELPTAFMCIHRSAFAQLQEPYFKVGSRKEDFGEDIYFNRRWIETGNFCWVDSDINFTHTGTYSWRGNFYEHALASGMLVKKSIEEAA